MSEMLKCSREAHPEDTIITVGDKKIGGGSFTVIAGPCAVESENQILETAIAVKSAGADFLRGGAFKPRTSPYDFQGLGAEGLRLLSLAKRETGLKIVSEIVDANDIELYEDVDILQVGSRNMRNYSLLRAVGRTNKPVLLKRGLSATYEELLCSAEYIMCEGNPNIILCERGVRGFETYTRNMLDIAAVPVLKQLSHLPVIVDPSHAAGKRELVPSLSMAAAAAGADGLMVEVHCNPTEALSDGRQSIDLKTFDKLSTKLRSFR